MKQCHTCKTFSSRKARFCPACGSSFAVKLCPKLHPNPITAHYCIDCGSGDLSSPHPVSPPSLRVRLMLLLLIASVLILALTFFFTTLKSTGDLHDTIFARMTHTPFL